jgi:hypothetical protein
VWLEVKGKREKKPVLNNSGEIMKLTLYLPEKLILRRKALLIWMKY